MFRRPSCGLTALVRLTIPRLSPRQRSQDFRSSTNGNVAMLSSVLTANRKQSNAQTRSPSPLPGGGSRDEHNSCRPTGRVSTLSAKQGAATALGRSAEGLCASVERLRGHDEGKTRFAAEQRRRRWNSRTIEPSWRELAPVGRREGTDLLACALAEALCPLVCSLHQH